MPNNELQIEPFRVTFGGSQAREWAGNEAGWRGLLARRGNDAAAIGWIVGGIKAAFFALNAPEDFSVDAPANAFPAMNNLLRKADESAAVMRDQLWMLYVIALETMFHLRSGASKQ